MISQAPEQRGSGVVFVTPLKGAKQIKAADAAGFQTTERDRKSVV